MRRSIPVRLGAVTTAVVVACANPAAEEPPAQAGARLGVFLPPQEMTLAKQSYSGLTKPERLVVRNASDWPAVWARMHGPLSPPPGVIQPDFGEEMAIVAAMGEKPTGGFEITIDSVVRHERGVAVYVTERSPGASCGVTMALTQPVHAVRAPRTDGAVWWRERTVVTRC